MKRPVPPTALLFAVLLSVAPAAASAQSSVAAETPAPAATATVSLAPVAPTMESLVPADRMSPMVTELFAAMDGQRTRVRALRTELAATRDSRRALELQRSIALAKRDLELQLLRIQAGHARREGRVQVAAGLEAAITALTAPAETREPAPRPAPASAR